MDGNCSAQSDQFRSLMPAYVNPDPFGFAQGIARWSLVRATPAVAGRRDDIRHGLTTIGHSP